MLLSLGMLLPRCCVTHIRRWNLYFRIVDASGRGIRECCLCTPHIPAFADAPRSEVFFADTVDIIGPLGAKSQGECAINPVASAIANALKNATGVRFCHLPLTPDRIFDRLSSVTAE